MVGALFTSRLTNLFAERIPGGDVAADTNSFTPAAVNNMPDEIRDIIVGAYNDALTPVFAMLIPMLVASLLLVVFIKEVPLRSSHDESGELEAHLHDADITHLRVETAPVPGAGPIAEDDSAASGTA